MLPIYCFLGNLLLEIALLLTVQHAEGCLSWWGILFSAAGVVAIVVTVRTMIKNKTTMHALGYPSVLLMVGPFRISRNPIYLGMALILAGLPFTFRKPLMLVIPIVFVLFMDVLVIRGEETRLVEQFGETYRQYQSRVRRWI